MKKLVILTAFVFVNYFASAQDAQKALNDAIMSGMMDNVKAAVEKVNADVNKPYKDKAMDNYPLHMACFMVNPDMVAYFIEKNADVNTLNKFGSTPINILCQTTIQDAPTIEKMVKIVDMLIAKGANLNTLSKGGYSALTYAAEHNNLEIVKKLLAQKADPNLRGGGKFSYTALMYAAKAGNLEMVKALVGAGAKINEIRESHQGTVIITENAASMASDGNFADVLEYLKQNGAKAPKGRKIWQ